MIASVATGYMPIAPATSGTLSTTADKVPMIRFTAYTFPTVSSSQKAKSVNTPLHRNASTAKRIPRKNNKVAPSIR